MGQPIKSYSNKDGRISNDIDAVSLQHELSVQEDEKDGRLTPINYRPYLADLSSQESELLRRENSLLKIITKDLVYDDEERNRRINYLARSSIPILEIECAYNQIKPALRKASKIRQYTALQIHNDVDEETGLTSLQKQLAILDGDI